MKGNTVQSIKGQGDVCPECHGTRGMGGIFGCKCVDNSRLLTGSGKGKAKSEK